MLMKVKKIVTLIPQIQRLSVSGTSSSSGCPDLILRSDIGLK